MGIHANFAGEMETGGAAYTAPMQAGDLVVVGGSDGTVRAFGPG